MDTTTLTYDQFVTELEHLAQLGMQAAKNCLVDEYPEFWEQYFDTFAETPEEKDARLEQLACEILGYDELEDEDA